MTRPAPTLKAVLTIAVSHGAQEFCRRPFLYAFELEAGYENGAELNESALGFLARVRLWLSLLWGGRGAVFSAGCQSYNITYNRRMLRRERHKLPAARQADALAYHILCRKGLKACQQWLYNRGLIGRVRWCFRKDHWRAASRRCFANGLGEALTHILCAAPLSPD